MKTILDKYNKLEEHVLIASLVFTVILVFAQVIMRYVFNSSLSWSEELTRFIFIWQIWLGTSMGLREKKHIKVEVLQGALGPKAVLIMDMVANLIWMAACIYFAYGGTVLVLDLMGKNAISTAMSIPLWIVYAALPFSSFILVIRQALQLGEDLKNIRFGKGV
jgi:TRAP-type C4-dicarboxylate transport system permease small subunit